MIELSAERARELTAGFSGKRIIVLGDVMLDEFIWGRVRRISPEAPVPVVEIERQTLTLGGAGNVASNLKSLGASPYPIGVVGDDRDAIRLRDTLSALEIPSSALLSDQARPTTLKTRIIAQNQQVVRADRESRVALSLDIQALVVQAFERASASADALVVSDYGKGLLTPDVLKQVLGTARKMGLTVCLDPKSRRFDCYQPVTVITPNHHEAAEAAGIAADGDDGIAEAGRVILSSIDCDAVLITRGEEGMSLLTRGSEPVHIPTVAREVYDVTGAGDTVAATVALALASGATLAEAAILANHAAGVVVGKVGTASATVQELLDTIPIAR